MFLSVLLITAKWDFESPPLSVRVCVESVHLLSLHTEPLRCTNHDPNTARFSSCAVMNPDYLLRAQGRLSSSQCVCWQLELQGRLSLLPCCLWIRDGIGSALTFTFRVSVALILYSFVGSICTRSHKVTRESCKHARLEQSFFEVREKNTASTLVAEQCDDNMNRTQASDGSAEKWTEYENEVLWFEQSLKPSERPQLVAR